MKNWMRGGAVLAAGLLASGLGIGSAGAADGWETEHFEWGETLEDTCDIPGLTVEDAGSGVSRTRTVLQGPLMLPHLEEHALDTDVYTNLANGRSATLVEQRYGRDALVVANDDGTLRVVELFSSTRTLYDDQGTVLARAAGSASVEIVWDDAGTPSDRDDDEFLSFAFLRSAGTGIDLCEDVIPAIT